MATDAFLAYDWYRFDDNGWDYLLTADVGVPHTDQCGGCRVGGYLTSPPPPTGTSCIPTCFSGDYGTCESTGAPAPYPPNQGPPHCVNVTSCGNFYVYYLGPVIGFPGHTNLGFCTSNQSGLSQLPPSISPPLTPETLNPPPTPHPPPSLQSPVFHVTSYGWADNFPDNGPPTRSPAWVSSINSSTGEETVFGIRSWSLVSIDISSGLVVDSYYADVYGFTTNSCGQAPIDIGECVGASTFISHVQAAASNASSIVVVFTFDEPFNGGAPIRTYLSSLGASLTGYSVFRYAYAFVYNNAAGVIGECVDVSGCASGGHQCSCSVVFSLTPPSLPASAVYPGGPLALSFPDVAHRFRPSPMLEDSGTVGGWTPTLHGNAFVNATLGAIVFDGSFGTYADLGTHYLGGGLSTYTRVSTATWLRVDAFSSFNCIGNCMGGACTDQGIFWDQCVNSNPWIMNAVPTSTGCTYGDNLLELLMSNTASFAGASSCIGCWTHVATAIDYDGSWKVYVNGSLVMTGLSNPITNVARNIWLAKGQGCQEAYWHGAIADFQVYFRRLTAADVSALFTGVKPLIQDGSFEMEMFDIAGGYPESFPFSPWVATGGGLPGTGGWGYGNSTTGGVRPIFNFDLGHTGEYSYYGASPLDGDVYVGFVGRCSITQLAPGFVVGAWYKMTFYYQASLSGNSLNVDVNSELMFSIASVTNSAWMQGSVMWQQTASTTTNFTFYTTASGRTLLDDIQVVESPAPSG